MTPRRDSHRSEGSQAVLRCRGRVIRIADGRSFAFMTDGWVRDPAEPYLALDVYHHPFIHRDFSTVEDEDSQLASPAVDVVARVMSRGMDEA
jgi:hypothetical protein